MHQAVCQYVEHAAEKLRGERQYCRDITVFLRTSPFASNDPYYANSNSVQLMLATQDKCDVVAVAVKTHEATWRDGYRYQRAGIMLNDFCDINHSGLGNVWFAGQGINKAWAMRRELLSPSYTTRLSDIPNARLI